MIETMSLHPDWLTPDYDASVLLPRTARWQDGVLTIGEVPVTTAVAQFGSPVYILDEQDFRARATQFRDAFAPWRVYYASKAFLCSAVARWAYECGLGVDVCSAGEMAIARRGGVPASSLGVHGNNKSAEEMQAAIEAGVGQIIVDSNEEIDRLQKLAKGRRVPVLVRVTPDVEAHTHAYVQTAVADQKFGFALDSGAALAALLRMHNSEEFDLLGVHCHIGSQIHDTDGYKQSIASLVGLMAQFRDATGVQLRELGLGGGFGIGYTPGDAPMPATSFAPVLRAAVDEATTANSLDPFEVFIEPGRAIVGPACVAIYTVGTIKPVALAGGTRTYVAVDGGMGDNPRPSLYEAEYSALLAGRHSDAPPMLCRVVGRYCENADLLVRHTFLPSDLAPGDIIAVPSSGAYQRAMASNYNGSLRPPVVAVSDGASTVLIRRETIDDLLAIDVGR